MLDFFANLSPAEAQDIAWQFVLGVHDKFKNTPDSNPASKVCLSFDVKQNAVVHSELPVDQPELMQGLWMDESGAWCYGSQLPAAMKAMFDLYLPLLDRQQAPGLSIAHLGQSIDAQIATASGDGFFVTGEENRKHLHCLRALCDAVIVGSKTVSADNPQLTTRSVVGKNPVRVIIDSKARLRKPLHVFDDGQARTIILHQSSVDTAGLETQFGPKITNRAGEVVSQVERCLVPDTDAGLNVSAIKALLSSHELNRLFIEGGGVTVSHFFAANALDRLHIAVAPLLVGKGVQALRLEGVEKMLQAHRPPCAAYRMGDDVLWDFDVSALKYSGKGLVEDESTAVCRDSSVLERIY